MPTRGVLHHIELWAADPAEVEPSAAWGWLLARLGYEPRDRWPTGTSWSLGDTYVVIESGPDVHPGHDGAAAHERRRPGLNHLAFHAGSPADVEAITADAIGHGWRLLFADAHPYAGGPDHYAAYLENDAGFEIELVAEAKLADHAPSGSTPNNRSRLP